MFLFLVALIVIEIGSHFAWSSPYLARLIEDVDSPIPLTDAEGSWIASLLNLGRIVGAIFGAVIVVTYGSRKCVLVSLIPMILSWALICYANSAAWLYASRTVAGFSVGVMFTSFPLFVGEVAKPSNRGAIISIAFCGNPISAIITSFLGSFMSLANFGICLLVPCFIALGIFLYLPESPQHLIKQGDLESAKNSLKWYRGAENVDKEFNDVVMYVNQEKGKIISGIMKELKTPYIRKVLFIVVMLYVFMHCCGLNSLVFYAESLLRKAQFDLVSPSLMVVYSNFVGAVATFISIFMIDKCGRKILLTISSVGVALAMAGLGTHFLLMTLGYDAKKLQLIPSGSLFLFQLTFSVGFLPVPSTILGEVFPSNIKSSGACLATIVSGIFGFAVSKSFQPLVDSLGESYVLYAHMLLALTAIPFVLICVPETKGKSLHQIQQDLMHKS